MTELEQYRQEIDRIDGELVKLFLERMAVTGKVGEYKQREGIPVLDANREKQVIVLRFGLEDGHPRTLEEVGREFNVTRERIRQIEAKALRKLRNPVRSKRIRDFL